MRPDGKQGKSHKSGEISNVEWAVAIVGAALVLATLAVIALGVTNGNKSPPEIMVKITSVEILRSGYVVLFRAENRGGTTAADVTIEGRLEAGEAATTRIDYLPPGSARGGGLFFKSDPRRGRLELVARGYQDP